MQQRPQENGDDQGDEEEEAFRIFAQRTSVNSRQATQPHLYIRSRTRLAVEKGTLFCDVGHDCDKDNDLCKEHTVTVNARAIEQDKMLLGYRHLAGSVQVAIHACPISGVIHKCHRASRHTCRFLTKLADSREACAFSGKTSTPELEAGDWADRLLEAQGDGDGTLASSGAGTSQSQAIHHKLLNSKLENYEKTRDQSVEKQKQAKVQKKRKREDLKWEQTVNRRSVKMGAAHDAVFSPASSSSEDEGNQDKIRYPGDSVHLAEKAERERKRSGERSSSRTRWKHCSDALFDDPAELRRTGSNLVPFMARPSFTLNRMDYAFPGEFLDHELHEERSSHKLVLADYFWETFLLGVADGFAREHPDPLAREGCITNLDAYSQAAHHWADLMAQDEMLGRKLGLLRSSNPNAGKAATVRQYPPVRSGWPAQNGPTWPVALIRLLEHEIKAAGGMPGFFTELIRKHGESAVYQGSQLLIAVLGLACPGIFTAGLPQNKADEVFHRFLLEKKRDTVLNTFLGHVYKAVTTEQAAITLFEFCITIYVDETRLGQRLAQAADSEGIAVTYRRGPENKSVAIRQQLRQSLSPLMNSLQLQSFF